MQDGARVLLGRAIDYAGLFPPAELPMDEAMRAYAAGLSSPGRWMLARFVCPASRLGEVEPLLGELFPAGPPMMLAVLGAGGETAEDLLANMRAEAAAVRDFVAAHRGRVAVDQFETRLPDELVARCGAEELAGVMREAGGLVARCGAGWVLAVFEVPVTGAPPERVVAAVEGIARAGADLGPADGWGTCCKVRCGGREARAFPSPEELAGVVTACRDRDVLLKATQGLHHPFRHFNRAAGTRMHGFVNLLVAGTLTRARGLGPDELAALLADEDPRHFELSDAGLAWLGRSANVAEIAAGRRFAISSFGSCSLSGPRDDLRALGLLMDEGGA